MAVITAQAAGDARYVAFLDLIGFSEGTATSVVTRNYGYDVIVTGVLGPETFTDYSHHPFASRPPKLIRSGSANSKALYSTASGRYQILRGSWEALVCPLKLADFSPLSQDVAALEIVRERGALLALGQGNIKGAITLCSNIWASLPGNGYAQPGGKSIATLMAKWTELTAGA